MSTCKCLERISLNRSGFWRRRRGDTFVKAFISRHGYLESDLSRWFLVVWSITNVFVGQVAAAELPSNRVLVIGIDGCRPDALAKAVTPHLDSLIQTGAFSDQTQILGERYTENDTVSGPGWSSFLTGVWADKHGVQNNSFQGKNYEAFPHFFAYIKQQFPKAQTGSFVDWKPIDTHIVSHADVQHGFDAHGADGYTKFDEAVTSEAVKFLSEGNPHAVMAYLGAVDETGHRYGFHPSVPEYIEAIETVDTRVGQLLTAMKSRPNFAAENWLVVVSTDHGGQGLGHGGGHKIPEIRTTFLIVSGSAAKQGKIEQPTYVVDVPVIALTHLGVEIQADWKLDGKPAGLTNRGSHNE